MPSAQAIATEHMLTDCPDGAVAENFWLAGHLTAAQVIAVLDQPWYTDWFSIDAVVAAAINSVHVHMRLEQRDPIVPEGDDHDREWWTPCEADDPGGAPWTVVALADHWDQDDPG